MSKKLSKEEIEILKKRLILKYKLLPPKKYQTDIRMIFNWALDKGTRNFEPYEDINMVCLLDTFVAEVININMKICRDQAYRIVCGEFHIRSHYFEYNNKEDIAHKKNKVN